MNTKRANSNGHLALAAMLVALSLAGSGAASLRAQGSKTQTSLNHKELHELIVNAKSPADHQKLASYYQTKAEAAGRIVAEHEAMLQAYLKDPTSHIPAKAEGGADHWCETLIRIYRQKETADLRLAASHNQMAKQAAQNKL